MKRIYLKPTSHAINIEAEQMIAASGDMGGRLPDIHPEPASNRMNSSLWDATPFNDSENDIWK